jgi:hypothetical protein
MTFDPDKSYSIGVWDMRFYVVDEDGEPITNKDGTVKLFDVDNYDLSYLCDGLDVTDLTERYPHKE